MIEIIATIETTETRAKALLFGACLAVDRGVSNEIVKISNGHRVIAEDQKAVDFILPRGGN